MEAAIVISSEIARRGHCLCEISELPDGVTRKSTDDYPLYMLCANLGTAYGAAITIGSEIARRGHCLCEVSERSNGISRRSVDDLLL